LPDFTLDKICEKMILFNLLMMKKLTRNCFCLSILILLSFSVLDAQDLTGIWRGHFRSNNGIEKLAGNYDDRYKIEVQIAQTHNHLEAVTYSYKSAEFYGKAEAAGSLNIQTRKVLLKEGKLLEVRTMGGVCVMTCFMQYSKLGNDEYLQGTYYSTGADDSTSDCGKGSIFLHRVTESDFHKEPFLEKKEKELLARKSEKKPSAEPPVSTTPIPLAKKNVTAMASSSKAASGKPGSSKVPSSQPGNAQLKSSQILPGQSQSNRDSSIKASQLSISTPVPYVLKSRTNDLLKTITVNNSSIELRIYDDGAIDNDTVSVYYDNKLIVSKARLSDQPITVHITIEPSDHPHQLVMVAENLGDIPPNTSLLVVRDGEKRYEERIISTEQKNVAINFIYKKVE
jgi:hypothetical protein